MWLVGAILIFAAQGVDPSPECSNPSVQASMLSEVCHKLHCGCIVLVVAANRFHTDWITKNQFLALSRKLVPTASLSVSNLRTQQQVIACGNKLPLFVVNGKVPLEQVKFQASRWVLLTPVNESRSLSPAFNSQVLQMNKSQDECQLIDMYRLEHETILREETIGRFYPKGDRLNWTEKTLYERRNQLHGLRMRVFVDEVKPFSSLNELGEFEGFFAKIWSILEHQMNFSSVFIPGRRLGDTCDGSECTPLSNMQSQRVHAAIGDLSFTKKHSEKAEILRPILMLRYHIYLREPAIFQAEWSAFLLPFTDKFWLALVMALFVIAITLSCFQCIESKLTGSSVFHQPDDAVFYVFAGLCQQGQPEPLSIFSGCRVLIATFLYTSVVVVTSYSAILISFITVHKPILPFQDLHGLINDGTYQLGCLHNSTEHEFFQETSEPIMQLIYKKLMASDTQNFPNSDTEGFNRICNKRFAYLIPQEYKEILSPNISCPVVNLPSSIFRLILSIAVTKNSPYKDLFNHNLQLLHFGGFIQKMHRDIWPKQTVGSESTWVAVDLKHLATLLGVLVCGVIVALSVLILEIFTDRIQQKLNRTKSNMVQTTLR